MFAAAAYLQTAAVFVLFRPLVRRVFRYPLLHGAYEIVLVQVAEQTLAADLFFHFTSAKLTDTTDLAGTISLSIPSRYSNSSYSQSFTGSLPSKSLKSWISIAVMI